MTELLSPSTPPVSTFSPPNASLTAVMKSMAFSPVPGINFKFL